MTKQKRVAIYLRVSTKDQSTKPQEFELKQFAKNRGWIVTRIYTDKKSGALNVRPALDELMADCRKRKVDAVLVWKFDRFARSVSHLLRALENFRALGVEFVSLSEQVDTSTPTGKMVFTVLGAVAELERSLIVERVKAGLRNARAKGKRLGRPSKGVDATKVVELRRQGLTWRRVGKQLGVAPRTALLAVKRCE